MRWPNPSAEYSSVTRSPFLDISRGIGISLVVLGHNWITIYGSDELFRLVYSFHVPLFFFLSGVLFNPAQEIKRLVCTKFQSVLKPYLCLLFLWGFVEIIFKGAKFSEYFSGVLIANGHSITLTPLWFLPHLFLVFVFSWCTTRVFHLTRTPLICQLMVLSCMLILGVRWIDMFWRTDLQPCTEAISPWQRLMLQHGLPLSADILFVTSAFFLSGYYLSRKVFEFIPTWKNTALPGLIFILLHGSYDVTLDLNVRRYDDMLVSTLQAALGIYLVICCSKLISVVGIGGRLLAYMGSGSIFVLLFHTFFQGRIFAILDLEGMGIRYIIGILAFGGSIAAALLLGEIIKKSRFLKIMFLPDKCKLPDPPRECRPNET